jgi:hypothetical protein
MLQIVSLLLENQWMKGGWLVQELYGRGREVETTMYIL